MARQAGGETRRGDAASHEDDELRFYDERGRMWTLNHPLSEYGEVTEAGRDEDFVYLEAGDGTGPAVPIAGGTC